MSGSGSRPEKERSQTSSEIAKHATINLVGGIFTPAASFATGPLLAHALSVDGRGDLAAATMPLVVAVTVATLGLPEAVTYFVAQDRLRTRMLLKRGILLVLPPAIVGTIVLILASAWISNGNTIVKNLIVISAALIAPCLVLSVVRGAAAAHNKWTLITIERIFTATSKLIPMVILFTMDELTLFNAAMVTMASTLTGAIVYVPLLWMPKPTATPDAVAYMSVAKFGSGIWFGTLSGIILLRIDQVLLAPLAGSFELGLYAVAVSISELPLIVNNAIRETSFTHLSDRGAAREVVGDLSRISTLVVTALCLPVALLSPVLISPLFGSDFTDSTPVVFILLLAVCLGNPGSIAGVALSSSGFPHLRSFALFAACVANIAILYLLAPSYGAIGAAVATLVGNMIASNLCILWMIRRRDSKLGDFYHFRPDDFTRIRGLIVRGVRRLPKKGRAK